MSKTKEKILSTALQLFNERGISQVSLRTISGEMQISLGNLTYHFKKREDIIEALYLQLVDKMNSIAQQGINHQSPLSLFFQTIDALTNNFYEFRFILLDFVAITRNNPTIRSHYRQLLFLRLQQFKYSTQQLIELDYLRPPLVKDEYEFLFQSLRILSDFWLSAAATDHDEIALADVLASAKMFKLKLLPYLTEKGRKEFIEWLEYKAVDK